MRIAADFPHPSPAPLLALLAQYEGPERLRVLRCIIHLAKGNRERLLDALASARTDYRDVIYWAEYEGGSRRIRDLTRPFVGM
ncbi:MAG: hypothetical protein KA603_03315 [Azonexus sp.]|jgi:hypothetical protein|nr:hypothetical protein [Betaproteobacteria bacterium]MBK8917384.1 hypothetical protein [Betaproteobacteria bacterium]MBP6035146.1 hypothetical protein [Azonexus sp.]MBP6905876.1 hypothetical protein [Azonexus sp.]